MNIDQPHSLLGDLSPQTFMRRHWQKKPLLIRQAVPQPSPFVDRATLFELASRDAVESRLIVHDARRWTLRKGPVPRRSLPALGQSGWTLLVQGLDLHLDAAHELLKQFRFVPDARLDDVMVSYATDGGGVGPHFDSYDVFLLQLHGRRRWRIGRKVDAALVPDVPLKILANFVAEEEWILEPGDMLYLPPDWAHDGVALGECMTCSIGFHAPRRAELGRQLMQRVLDEAEPLEGDPLYRDRQQAATEAPARVPQALHDFAAAAARRLLDDEQGLACALGEILSEPKENVSFDADPHQGDISLGVRLDRRTRMMYDRWFVFVNGESFRAGGRDAKSMQRLADARSLLGREVRALGDDARELLEQWADAGWLHAEAGPR
jgi:50S ribosomal protein L16 3-hydroxylase